MNLNFSTTPPSIYANIEAANAITSFIKSDNTPA